MSPSVFPSHAAQAASVALELIPNEGQEDAPNAGGMMLPCLVVHRTQVFTSAFSLLIVINQ